MKILLPTFVALGAFTLSACATTPPPPSTIEVAQFAAPDRQFANLGEVSVAAAPGQDRLLITPYLRSVSEEMSRLGWSVVSPRDGVARADVRVEQSIVAEGRRRSPVTVGAGGSTGTYGSGAGVGIGINLGGAPKDFIATTLGVMIRDGATGDSVWEGRANWDVRSDASEASDEATAENLAAALFEGFPDGDGGVIDPE